jgi:glycosyltransferase involved in cell wall biosynthesis
MHVITELDVGGAEVMLTKLLSAMDPGRFRHSVLSLKNKGPMAAQIEKLGISVFELNLHRPFSHLNSRSRLRKVLSRQRPALIQGWMYHGNLAASLFHFPNRRKRPVIWNIRHSLNSLKQEKILTRMVVRAGALFSGSPAGIIYNAHVSADQHAALGYSPKRAHVIPNGFDLKRFRPNRHVRQKLRSQLGVPKGGILIGLIARYHPMKDHVNFLRAASLIAKKSANVRFLILGRNVDNPASGLIRHVEALGLTNRVTFLGEHLDIESFLAALDIASLSSYGEGFPNVVGEAMACGIPCVVTDVGDCRRLVGKTGIVVPPRDAPALKKGWERLMDKGQLERENLGSAARRRMFENFEISKIAGQYGELYQRIMDSKRERAKAP